MRDSYVSNLQEILSANEAQRGKIIFLERQSKKRQGYMQDLEESLKLNKQTIKELNTTGPNLKAIQILVHENERLTEKLQKSYQEYQNISALLLMETQLKSEDKSFYNSRIIEFENKINELRKYLHDKEDSFSAVINRLKKYEEMNELPIEEKLKDFKNEMHENITLEVVSQLTQERNYYRNLYEVQQKNNSHSDYQFLKQCISNQMNYQKLKESTLNLKQDCRQRRKSQDDIPKHEIEMKKDNQSSKKEVEQYKFSAYEQTKNNTINTTKVTEKSKLQNMNVSKEKPNKQLIRLLKKEKLQTEILQDALNEAIEKNEQLLQYQETLVNGFKIKQENIKQLKAENALICLLLGEYDNHYSRKVFALSKKSLTDQDMDDLRYRAKIIDQKIKDYSESLKENYIEQFGLYSQKLKKENDRKQELFALVAEIKHSKKQGDAWLIKSASEPRLLPSIDLEEIDGMMEIDEY